MERDYDFAAVEQHWMKTWIEGKLWAAPDVPDPELKRYALTMYPYPSGDMHMGHVEIFSIHDAVARYMRMHGYQVLNPFGFDSFGLPAENAAIKRGIDPKKWTYDNIDKLWSSTQRLGISFDWDRRLATSDPEYYRWNQWLFLRLYERGLAYKREAPVNWCPKDKTVLANEQVIAGRCERCDTPVVKRNLAQWFFKITDYADALLDDIEMNRWGYRLKVLQRNWIGRSYGAEVTFVLEGIDEPVVVYTTRPDTLWGATFFVLAPEHPLAEELAAGTDVAEQLAAYKEEVGRMTEIDRTSTERDKSGLFLGKYATNPVNCEGIPIWVADYVLMDYGTGAIMAVPAHDQRDFEFARKYDLPIRVVISPAGSETLDSDQMTEAYPHDGVMVNSGVFDGTPADRSVKVVTDWLQEKGLGRHAVNFRLRDWLISRQRYWGTPIPIVYCEVCGEVPVPDEDLPVELPEDVDFHPQEGVSPLATSETFMNVSCPKCGADARRDADTMDTIVDSAWYFHRYVSPNKDDGPFDVEMSRAWMPMDIYTGGIEHAVLHLLYARFIQKVLVDMGLSDAPEPFPHTLNQGTITMGGKRMSKSRGNLVDPQEAFEKYGADALRLYMLFSGPPEADFDWPEEGVAAIEARTFRWLNRVWQLCEEGRDATGESVGLAEEDLRGHIHRTIKVVTEDFERYSYNTAIARLQELVNDAYRYRAGVTEPNGALIQRVRERLGRIGQAHI
ncbi:MAG: leucine--tRNA ligase, partial [Actinomycetota bacterium]